MDVFETAVTQRAISLEEVGSSPTVSLFLALLSWFPRLPQKRPTTAIGGFSYLRADPATIPDRNGLQYVFSLPWTTRLNCKLTLRPQPRGRNARGRYKCSQPMLSAHMTLLPEKQGGSTRPGLPDNPMSSPLPDTILEE